MPQNLEKQFRTELDRLKHHQRTQRTKQAGLLLLVAIALGWTYWTRNQVPAESTLASPIPVKSIAPEPSYPPVSLPLSGALTPAKDSNQATGQFRLFLASPTSTDDSKLENRCSGQWFGQNQAAMMP